MNTNIELPGYKITELLYTGTRTIVYRAIRSQDNMGVVIKLLRKEYPTFNDIVQFRNQYIITKPLDFIHIIKPLDLEYRDNGYALIMENFGGVSLSSYLKSQNPLLLKDFLIIGIQLTETLDYLYRNCVIHKDIKPANILIEPQSKQIKLIDFSISSLLPKEAQEIENISTLEGSLAYLSPEQTGRMNRGIDYRTDFYSLGITFYELLTGKLPFTSEDAMELVHCHLAKKPPLLNQINSQIPQVIADIINKLIAKNAEDRYQNALGIKHDLENCLNQLEQTDTIERFEIGKRDINDRFIIPEKLYGRDKEVHQILNTFERVIGGTTEIMLVAGFSGIGKTAVVNEVHKPIVRQRGYFIKGKFDQFNRNIPLSAFVQSFRDLMEQLLSETDSKIEIWKQKILAVLGDSGQVLIDVIPELENIIGKQPPAIELSGTTAQNRFNLLFQQFFQIFTTKEHPLVLFLDDLQWADSASLNLLKLLTQETGYLLILGAYRDNEVYPLHPLILTIDEIVKTGTQVNTINLLPLTEPSLNQLIAETLKCELLLAELLTKLVYQKTQGNPFFATQFLKSLHEDKLINFDWEQQHWQCDIAQITALAITDDVVEFMALQLQKLNQKTQDILKLAACIGAEFDLQTLAIVSQQKIENTAIQLWPVLQENLVIPTTKIYKFFTQIDTNKDNKEILKASANPTYRFLHDRVQQAAYSLIPDEQKQSTHLAIARLLRQNISDSELEAKIFDIANHWNRAIDLIVDPNEKNSLAQLYLSAGHKAKASIAYELALKYYNTGLALLSEDSWQTQFDLMLALHESAAEAAFLCNNFEQMEQQLAGIFQQQLPPLQRIKAYQIQIQAYNSQGRFQEAIEIGRRALKEFNTYLPEQTTFADVQSSLQEVTEILDGRTANDLLDLPLISEPQSLATLQLLSSITATAYNSEPLLFSFLVLTQVKLSIQKGNSALSAFIYSCYGILLSSIVEDLEGAYEFGLLGLKLLDKFNAQSIRPKVNIAAAFTMHGKSHCRNGVPLFKETFEVGLEVGDLEYVGYGTLHLCQYVYLTGQNLAAAVAETAPYLATLQKLNMTTGNNYSQAVLQTIERLQGTQDPWEAAAQSEQLYSALNSGNDLSGLFVYWVYKLSASYLLEEMDRAVCEAAEARQTLAGGTSQITEFIFYFYDSLTALAVYSEASNKTELLERVSANQKKLQHRAHHAPMNFQHKYDLVEAEKRRVLGHRIEAVELYESAITGAKENGYLQEEALANELTAKFYLNWGFDFAEPSAFDSAQPSGKEKIAADYMQEAYFCYARWGAKAKILHLEQKYHKLLKRILQSSSSLLSPEVNISSISKNSTSSISNDNLLDFLSVTKAAQAISAELDLEHLLEILMETTVANAGAQTGILLVEEEGELFIVATAQPNHKQILHIPLTNYPNIPQNLIYYVARTHKDAVFDDLSASPQFASDNYVISYQPKSVLCTPINKKGKLIAILYLENNLILGAFNQERIATIQVLTSQAAVSIENARLYKQVENYSQTLEAEVEKKTRDLNQKAMDLEQVLKNLQQTQSQLIQSEKMSAMGQFVAGIAHEINNPINFIIGNIDYTGNYVKDLLKLLRVYQQEYPEPTPIIQETMEEIEFEYIWNDLTSILQSMKVGSERIQQIIISLRNFSRLDEATMKKVDIHSGIESTLLILKSRIEGSGNHQPITVIKEYGTVPLITCYAGEMNQVFLSLITNAIDAVQDNNLTGKVPTIKIQTQTLTNAHIRIIISDNGTGIASDIQHRIFEPFFTTKPVGSGTGLGLSVSYAIIKKHGGQLTCNSTLGIHTEFIVEIPINPTIQSLPNPSVLGEELKLS